MTETRRIRLIKHEDWVRQADAWLDGCTVYVIEEPESGFCKVGIAEHPVRRWSSLQCGNPRPIVLRAAYSGNRDDCRLVERRVLSHFPLLRGEWMEAALADILAYINAFGAQL